MRSFLSRGDQAACALFSAACLVPMPRSFAALQIDFVANVQILRQWPFLLQLFCLGSAYLSLLLVALTHLFSSLAQPLVLIFHTFPHKVLSPGHYFELPNPCCETSRVRSILICTENSSDSVFTSCWSLDCFPTNSSIPFITKAKCIRHAVRWLVRGHADLCETQAFLVRNKFSFIILDSYLLDLYRPASTEIDKADYFALKATT